MNDGETTEPNDIVAPVHPKAMSVILTEPEQLDTWLHAPAENALELQRPLRDGAFKIAARGERTDAAPT